MFLALLRKVISYRFQWGWLAIDLPERLVAPVDLSLDNIVFTIRVKARKQECSCWQQQK